LDFSGFQNRFEFLLLFDRVVKIGEVCSDESKEGCERESSNGPGAGLGGESEILMQSERVSDKQSEKGEEGEVPKEEVGEGIEVELGELAFESLVVYVE